jgi:hypothetical protein
MGIAQQIQEVLNLQKMWAFKNTPEMERRGILVRQELAESLRHLSGKISSRIGISSEDLLVQGRDGLGNKTEIPWTRFGSKLLTPKATDGWYVVLLFAADGSACWLSLSQGSTTWDGQMFKSKDAALLLTQANDLRVALRDYPQGWDKPLDLRAQRTVLGEAYEACTALAVPYFDGEVPTEEQIIEDVLTISGLLGRTYSILALRGQRGDIAPEIQEALDMANESAGKKTSRSSGQGFRLTQPQKRAIELRAIALATEFLFGQGWESVEDVGDRESFDLECRRSEDVLYVEVKGTTSLGQSVVLTRNEVALHKEVHPSNALIIVSEIDLDRETSTATGGKLNFISPWVIADEDLQVVSYTYQVNSE